MSVTSRRRKMKRPPSSWKEKVDGFCLKFLEVYKEARRLAPAPTTDLNEFVRRHLAAHDPFRDHSDFLILKSVTLTPEFLKLLEPFPEIREYAREGENQYPIRIAQTLEFMQAFVPQLEANPKLRLAVYLFPTFAGVVLVDIFKDMYEREFGSEPPTTKRLANIAAQFFEMLAQFCRGRYAIPKGRINMELVELLKVIQEHQKEPLRADEIREALLSAGVAVPEGETWRLWLWRAKRRGLIKEGVGSKRQKRR